MGISVILITCLTSCGVYYDKAIAANGNSETIVYPFLGGTATVTGANGAHFTHDHQQSFRDGVTAAGAAYSAQQTRITTVSTNANNNAATTQQQLNQQNFQLQQQALQNAAAKTAGQQAIAKQAQANGLPIPAPP